ncbi:MAG: hypothetical protein Ta2E_07480 [Mycoplasmoidaceae bacterium]|nr:MAG: hypothetical protein Ta2E_07480 [Mycoplasmoidaceae bacterium]
MKIKDKLIILFSTAFILIGSLCSVLISSNTTENHTTQQPFKTPNLINTLPTVEERESYSDVEINKLYSNLNSTFYDNNVLSSYFDENFNDDLNSKEKHDLVFNFAYENNIKLVDVVQLKDQIPSINVNIHNAIVGQSITDEQKMDILKSTEIEVKKFEEKVEDEIIVLDDLYDASYDLINNLQIDYEEKEKALLNIEFNDWISDSSFTSNKNEYFDNIFIDSIINDETLYIYSTDNTKFLSNIINVNDHPLLSETPDVNYNPSFNLLTKFVDIDQNNYSFDISFIAQSNKIDSIFTEELVSFNEETQSDELRTFQFKLDPSPELDKINTKNMFESNYLNNDDPLNWSINPNFNYLTFGNYKFNSYSFNNSTSKTIDISTTIQDQKLLEYKQYFVGKGNDHNDVKSIWKWYPSIDHYTQMDIYLTQIKYQFDVNNLAFNDLINGEFLVSELLKNNMISNFKANFTTRDDRKWNKWQCVGVGKVKWEGAGAGWIKNSYHNSPYLNYDSDISLTSSNSYQKCSHEKRYDAWTGNAIVKVEDFWNKLCLNISKDNNKIKFEIKLPENLLIKAGMGNPTDSKSIKIPNSSITKSYSNDSCGEAVDLSEIPNLILFKGLPYTYSTIPGYSVHIQFLEKISSIWNSIATGKADFILKFRLLIKNNSYEYSTSDNVYTTRNFSMNINSSLNDLNIVYQHAATVLATSFGEIPDIEPINQYVDHVLQYEILQTVTISIAVICQVALLISYAASWGLCVPLLVEAIAAGVYIGLSVAEIVIDWNLYTSVCSYRNKIKTMLASQDYLNLKKEFDNLSNSNPNKLNDPQSIVGWTRIAFGITKGFVTFFNNNLFAFQGKLAQLDWYPPKWVKPFSMIASIIFWISTAIKLIVDIVYSKYIFVTDFNKINKIYIQLTT